MDAGLASRSVARRLSALRQMMGWLVEERIREDNPMPLDRQSKQPGSLPKEPVRNRNRQADCRRRRPAVEEPVAAHDGDAGASLCNRAAGVGTGALPVDQFRRDLASIVVAGKGGKERLVALGTPARAAVAAWIEERDATDSAS